MPLTDRQSAYIKARADGMTGAAAARAAGYSTKGAAVAAARLEKRPEVAAAIAAALAERQPAPAMTFETAQDYLQAVVAGRVPPDPVRVAAARALLAYERPRTRRPLPAERTPKQEAEIAAIRERRLGPRFTRASPPSEGRHSDARSL